MKHYSFSINMIGCNLFLCAMNYSLLISPFSNRFLYRMNCRWATWERAKQTTCFGVLSNSHRSMFFERMQRFSQPFLKGKQAFALRAAFRLHLPGPSFSAEGSDDCDSIVTAIETFSLKLWSGIPDTHIFHRIGSRMSGCLRCGLGESGRRRPLQGLMGRIDYRKLQDWCDLLILVMVAVRGLR
jgi:hypothetical protein